MPASPIAVFDGHNDTLLKLELEAGTVGERSFFEAAGRGHIDLPRAREGQFVGGFFAMFVPSKRLGEARFDPADPENFATVDQKAALDLTNRMMARAQTIEAESAGRVAICRSVSDIRATVSGGAVAMLLHIEGAEAIDSDFTALADLHARGLRSLGPVWSRPNAFAHGVPMTFPASPDTGPGLTPAGEELVRACNRLGVVIDLSHITEKGFWDVARITDKPLVATHSNAHALCPSPRNLTDRQLDAIRESGGVVGLNFHVAFLRPDGAFKADTPLELMVRHVDHLISRLGPEGVAIGSDFDGCLPPRDIGDVRELPRLFDALRAAGYDEPLLNRIGWGNWLSVLERSGL